MLYSTTRFLAFLTFCILFAGSVYASNTSYKAFRVTITGKGQPMLFIPGATCSGDEWNESVAHYSATHQCHVFTLAGYAGIPPLDNAPYLETMKNQIEQYIRDNKLNNIILVGHSIGGVLAMWIASDMKDHLQKVIIVDAMPFFAITLNPNATSGFSDVQAKSMLDYYNKMDDAQLKAAQLKNARFMCLDSTRWEQIAAWGLHSDRKTMAYTMVEMLGKDLRQAISNIKVPVLVLAAYSVMPEYPAFTRDMVTTNYAAQYQACKTCTIDVAEGHTRHFIMYDAPEWYFKEIDTFIKG